MISEEFKMYSKTETAKLLGLGKSTVAELISSGRLGFIQIGKRQMIPLVEIQRFLDESLVVLSPPSETFQEETIDSAQFLESLINNN